MCRAITCNRCGRPSWAGCGAHVEQVLRHIPHDKRCRCREQSSADSGGGLGKKLRGLFGL